MTREETKKAAETMLAHAEGKEIEILVYDYNGRKEWGDCKNPDWNWDSHDYRIKPQQVSIPATEEEISYIESVPKLIVKSKWSNEIHVLPKEHEQYKKECLIYNPDTKCWEDWGE